MKAIMMSTQPKWIEKIANDEKKIEVRKKIGKWELPIKVYLYCTKAKPSDTMLLVDGKLWVVNTQILFYNPSTCVNGKVAGEFVCDRIDEYPYRREFGYEISEEDFNATMLTADEFCGYGNQETLYGLHISDLKIYDKPKELSEFRKPCTVEFNSFACHGCDYYNYHLPLFDGVADLSKSWCSDGSRILMRPPQSWCYVEAL